MMGTVRQLATTIEEGLRTALPTLRKTVVTKLALAVGALLEAQAPNAVDLANVLPPETERQDLREQWLRRLLSPMGKGKTPAFRRKLEHPFLLRVAS
jgi:hypothetical protein